MRCLKLLSLALALLGTTALLSATPKPPARILKVLQFRLDKKDRIALSPSLFERDAYQAILRRHTNQCAGMRFDIQWQAKVRRGTALRLRMELLATLQGVRTPVVVEQPVVVKSHRTRWSFVTVKGADFRRTGTIVAWRATLWEGDHRLAEEHSFLW